MIYARKAFAAQNPDAVRAFLAAWFETIDYMKGHRAETIALVQTSANLSAALAARDYDELSGMFNSTGRFNPAALAVLSRSFVEMGMLPTEPDMKALVTEEFLAQAQSK